MSAPLDASEPSSSPSRPLAARVQAQVDAATVRISAHQRAARRKPRTRLRGSERPLELRALLRVFREMGRTQRSARRQTGQAPSLTVRKAALAFQQAPSLPALVVVAATLDDVGLLFW